MTARDTHTRTALSHLATASALLDSGELDGAILANERAMDEMYAAAGDAERATNRDATLCRCAPLTPDERDWMSREADRWMETDAAADFEYRR